MGEKRDDLKLRLRKELEHEAEELRKSKVEGERSFVEWIGDLLKSLYNIVTEEIIGGIANWLWNLFFGKEED